MLNKIKQRIILIFKNIKMAIISLTWKKDRRVVLFGSWFGEKFADNSRFLFQYMADNKEALGLKSVGWVTRSETICNQLKQMGYDAYLMGTKESVKFHKLAGYHIICDSSDDFAKVPTDIETRYSWRAKRINLWHGVVSFKGVGYGAGNYEKKKKAHPLIYGIKELLHKSSFFRKFIESSGGWGDCYFLSTTPYKTDSMITYFRLPRNHYIESAVARLCGEVRLLPIEQKVMSMIKVHKHCICYFPTFRGEGSSFDVYEAAESIKDYLNKEDVLWIQKFHSASSARTETLTVNGNIVTLPHDFDINTIIPKASMVMTDYSSVTGDAIYYKKPLAFYVPDMEEYNSTDRGFIIDPKEVMCGRVIKEKESLKAAVNAMLNEEFVPDEKYMEIFKRYFSDKRNIECIWEDIKERV